MIVVGCETICFRWWAMLRFFTRHLPLVEKGLRQSVGTNGSVPSN
jgi:hypothetical protein